MKLNYLKSTQMGKKNLLMAVVLYLVFFIIGATCPPKPQPANPKLAVFPNSLDFDTIENSKDFTIANIGTGTLNWNVSADQAWINVIPSSGNTAAESDKVTVIVDRNAVNFGDHIGTLQVSSDGGKETITVKMSKKRDAYETEFKNVINSAGNFEDPQEQHKVDSTTTTEFINDDFSVCTTKRYSITETPQDFPNFDPNAEVVFPGNLLQGKTLADATPEPVIVKRASGKIVLTLVNGGIQASETVQEVSLSNVFDAMNKIINQNPGALPARFFFTVEELKSEKQLELELKANANILKLVKIDAALKFSLDRAYNRFLVQLNQTYFTMAYELPLYISNIFAPEVTPTDLSRYVGLGNPPAYISSVTYGRIFYLLIESTSKKSEISGSINASLASGIAGGQLSGKYLAQLENLRVKAYALGGDQGSAIRAVTANFEALKNFLAEGGNIKTGVPLSYNIRSLASNKMVKNKIATDYEIKDCTPTGNAIIWFEALEQSVEKDGAKVSKWKDASGHGSDAVTLIVADNYPLFINNAVNGSRPALTFATKLVSKPAYIPAVMRYYGGDFVGTDYTIFALINRKERGSEQYFMLGTDDSQYKNLKIGFVDDNTFELSHSGITLKAPLGSHLNMFIIYTMRFSKTEGMSIYVNGDLKAIDLSLTKPLIDYPGASITSGSLVGGYRPGFMIAEIKAYGKALTDQERQSVEKSLKRKYKL